MFYLLLLKQEENYSISMNFNPKVLISNKSKHYLINLLNPIKFINITIIVE